MIQILGYMVGAYGIARLFQTSGAGKEWNLLASVLGIIALVILSVMLTQQANSISNLGL